MKILLTKGAGSNVDESAIGLVHIKGPLEHTACGLAYEEYEYKATMHKVSCGTCLTFIDWAQKVAAHKRLT